MNARPARLPDAPSAAAEALLALAGRLRSPWFAPDLVAAADPLAPDPRVLVRGVAAAMRLCAAEDRPVRLLVSRAPGAVLELRLDAVRRRCIAELLDAPPAPAPDPAPAPPAPVPAPAPPRRAESALPPFALGAEPAVFRLEAGTDDLRLEFLPGPVRLLCRVR